jgi:beta-lactamase class A
MEAMIMASDNTATDMIFKVAGVDDDPATVNQFFRLSIRLLCWLRTRFPDFALILTNLAGRLALVVGTALFSWC